MGHGKIKRGGTARATLAICAVALWLGVLVPAAQAAPFHSFLDPESLSGFNHACGVATDTEGDLYVSSAGESKIRVFTPSHAEIGSVSNANEPCGLALDTNGNLYVSEKATGEVVKYHPSAYPFSGVPSYGAPTTIDASHSAKGIATDPADDRLYIAEGARISTYNAEGTLGEDEVQRVLVGATGGTFRLAMPADGGPGLNETQRVSLSGVTGGTFTLSFEGQSTTPIPFDATPAVVQAALEALSTIGAGNVSVIGRPEGERPWWVEFTGALAETNVPGLIGNGEGLVGASKGITVEALSDITGQIPYNATHAEVKTALEGLQYIGAGDISVEEGPNGSMDHVITFKGGLGSTDVPQLVGDRSALTGGSFPSANGSTLIEGFDGHIGEGVLSEATGVAAYSYKSDQRYVFAADPAGVATDRVYVLAGEVRALELRQTIDGSETPAGSLGFGPAGAYLSVDPLNGHLFLYDQGHNVVDEFEATGQYFARIVHAFADAGPTALAVYPQWSEVQKLEVKAEGGSFGLSFEGQSTHAEGTGDTSYAKGTGNVVRVSGTGKRTTGSTSVEVKSGSGFAANQAILGSGIPAETTILAVSGSGGAGSVLTLSKAATTSGESTITAGNVTAAAATEGAFAVGQTLTGTGIPTSTTILAVNGTTLTLSKVPSSAGSGVSLTAASKIVSNLATTSGSFLVGELISGAGIPAGATIAAIDEAEHKLTLSAAAAAAGSGVALSADLPYNATAEAVQEALVALSTIGKGNLSLSGSREGIRSLYTLKFAGSLVDRNLPQLGCDGSALTGTGSSCTTTTEKQGSGPGRIYVTSGADAGAQVLAFGPAAAPSRAPLPEPRTFSLNHACGTAVDSQGDLYVAAEATIRVYSPGHSLLTTINDSGYPCELAVDSQGVLYAADLGTANSGDEKIVKYTPSAYPLTATPVYSDPVTVDSTTEPGGIAVNPCNDHLLIARGGALIEYDSAAHGSGLLHSALGSGPLSGGSAQDVDVYKANCDIYVVLSGGVGANGIYVLDANATKRLAMIDGTGSSAGPFGSLNGADIAVDQANGHVVLAKLSGGGARGVAEEYEASGAFVVQFGLFANAPDPSDVAIDNSGGPNAGTVYVAFFEDLSAFGPLSYGEPPVAVTGTATEVGGGTATLNGTVDPRGFELEECRFEWDKAGEPYEHVEPCAETPAQIGSGNGPVAVHLEISGIAPETTRYRYRLAAKNKYGEGEGDDHLFGPPVPTTKPAQPILYREATLHGEVDPTGLETTYHFEYITHAQYVKNGETFAGAQSTPTLTLAASSGGPAEVEASPISLTEGTVYDFRLVAGNEAATVPGSTESFESLVKRQSPPCPNATLRLENNSSNLPDCRAYELVTPAETHGATPFAEGSGTQMFNNWLTTPTGPNAGGRLVFYFETTLPGTDGNGVLDAYRETRGAEGWAPQLFSPNYVQSGDTRPGQQGVSPDQRYSFWTLGGGSLPESLPRGSYLRTPEGFEPLGRGSLGIDPEAQGRYISASASHVIFTTQPPCGVCEPPVQLEPNAPPSPLGAVYDRTPGGATDVVSLLPGDITPAVTATYQGASADGSAVVFEVGNVLYVRVNDSETLKVADGPASFAGVSDGGKRVFYTTAAFGGADPTPGTLFAFDIPSQTITQIASSARFVNVSADGSRVYFTSEEALTGVGEENENHEHAEAGEANLYLWDGSGTHFIAVLDAQDLEEFGSAQVEPAKRRTVHLARWTASGVIGPNPNGITGRASDPSRSTPDGSVLVFQSHASLATYDSEGHSEVYRYDARAPAGKRLLCVSCNPAGVPAVGEGRLQLVGGGSPTKATTLIPNVTDDGGNVFFESEDSLLPEDANRVTDVYEWLNEGTGGCEREGGCLALISSGQSDQPSYIYSMTPDGHDVFFTTLEKLIGSDVAGSPSIYDARVEGGFPAKLEAEPCHGDACQGEGSPEPEAAVVRSDVPGSGNAEEPPSHGRCPKGRRPVKRNGKVHCAKKRGHHKHRRAHAKRRAGR